ncbi:MAG TPA: hypothetical protein VFW87_18540, partial [Pirellulales bacterium]|nr:hypothetical protein [Pirellulales bacterium]
MNVVTRVAWLHERCKADKVSPRLRSLLLKICAKAGKNYGHQHSRRRQLPYPTPVHCSPHIARNPLHVAHLRRRVG